MAYSPGPARYAFTGFSATMKITWTTTAFTTAAAATRNRNASVKPGWETIRFVLKRNISAKYAPPLARIAKNAAANEAT